MENLRKAVITHLSDGLGTPRNDRKYFSGVIGKEVELKEEVCPNFFLTDLYLPEFKGETNDYVRGGYLIVSEGNIEVI